ncbi:hypothetical protein IP90_00701 [Luteimonas cucumeris]|uniref:Yip1-like protein n=1 Tax=Luteimonas cucumeris TaxID=985012 RepID=A0A562LAD6_9GAMM|nr:hypothetical protein [Luteimonas cucumeris]TWI04568.1 hypothetical protein IP90_00701 [Luteimonas cucumeris]
MDFLKILKSFEEFIYEAMTWLVFYPRTLWRVVRHPIRMAQYADEELADPLREQFKDGLSPPFFLLLSVIISHVVELTLHAQMPERSGELAKIVLGSEQNLLIYRTISFGVWALLGAMYLLVRTHGRIDRDTLRRPFYAQCYLVAPFAISLSIGVTIARVFGTRFHEAGITWALVACAWFVAAQAGWLRNLLQVPWWRAIGATLLILLVGLVINTLVALALLGPL